MQSCLYFKRSNWHYLCKRDRISLLQELEEYFQTPKGIEWVGKNINVLETLERVTGMSVAIIKMYLRVAKVNINLIDEYPIREAYERALRMVNFKVENVDGIPVVVWDNKEYTFQSIDIPECEKEPKKTTTTFTVLSTKESRKITLIMEEYTHGLAQDKIF
jgi:hypothetical protein